MIDRRQFLKLSSLSTTAGLIPKILAEQQSDIDYHNAWQQRKLSKKPNILMVLLDDIGFGDLGSYGSELNTKCIDDLALNGTRFNNFHVTALCSPTRACLLTGRNAHAVGVGNIAEWGRDLPGYKGWIRQDAATLAEILKPQGYNNLAIGKWHLSSLDDQNASGPFHRWPTGRGFDRWYGFHGNAMDHWHPEMFENTVATYPDKTNDYHLSSDLAQRSIDYIQDHLASSNENPFFMYLAFGACHFPLQAPKSAILKHHGNYKEGYEAIRQQRFNCQKQLKIIPQQAQLSPLNENVKPWKEMSADEKKLAERGQEIYSAFLEHTDQQLASIVNLLKTENIYDDTLIIVMSDNGAAPGSSPVPSIDVRRTAYLSPETMQEKMDALDSLGSDASYGNSSTGWSQVSNTPLKWYKSDTFGGGTRAPLIVHWPNGKLPKNQIVNQYHHVIDIVPSILEMTNIASPVTLRGAKVLPLQGQSFAYLFDKPELPTPKQVQYFETLGDRAIWKKGWKAVCKHRQGEPFNQDIWELYHVENDFSEIDNLADQHPELLNQLILNWYEEAKRYQVLPMNDDTFDLYKKAVPPPRETHLFYPKMTRLDRLSAPDIYSFNSKITIQLQSSNLPLPLNGVVLASGDSGAGYEIFFKEGYLIFYYVYVRSKHSKIKSKQKITNSINQVDILLSKTESGITNITMKIANKTIGSGKLPKMWPIYTPNSGLRCGENRHAPISREYQQPYSMAKTLKRVIVEVDVQQS